MTALETGERRRTLVPPVDLRALRWSVAARFAIAGSLVVALAARWNGTVWAETLAVGAALTVVASVFVRDRLRQVLVFDFVLTGLFAIWLVLFACSIATAAPVATGDPGPEPAQTSPPEAAVRKVLHTYGPLSVVVDGEWTRIVQPPPEPFALVVTDGIAISFSAEPYALDESSKDLAIEADEMAKSIAEAEGLRSIDASNGTTEGFPTAERLLATEDRKTYCLLVVTDRDGFRIVGRGDTFADFGDRDAAGELRRVAASLRACGEGDEPRTDPHDDSDGDIAP